MNLAQREELIMTSYDDEDRDRLAEVAALWPYDGPHSDQTVIEAARAISELVRYINNATSTGRRYTYMSQASQVANSLAEAAWGLNQLLDQMSRRIADYIDTGDLYDDHCPNDQLAGTARADTARQQAIQAGTNAIALGRQLSQLSNTMSGIGHR